MLHYKIIGIGGRRLAVANPCTAGVRIMYAQFNVFYEKLTVLAAIKTKQGSSKHCMTHTHANISRP